MPRRCLALAVRQFLNWLLVAMSFRFLAAGSYAGVAVVDGLIAFLSFTLTQKIADATTRSEQLAYTVGGVLGSLAGMWLTKGVHP